MTARVARIVAAGVVGAASMAFALPASAEGPQDAVTGAGSVTFPNFPSAGESTSESFSVSAHSGPSGEDATGTILFRSPLLDRPVKIDVTCLLVVGDTAYVAGAAGEPFQYLGLTITHLALAIADNDAANDAAPELLTGLAFVNRPTTFDPCAATVAFAPPLFPVEQGNFVVHDAP